MSGLAAALEIYIGRLKQEASVSTEDLGRFAEAFVELGDRIHHEKEENVLLPLLSRNGFDWDAGVLSSVRSDHRQERYLIDVLLQASQRPGNEGSEARRHIVASATALIEFQRHHHELENRHLFPEISLRLGAPAQHELKAALERFDTSPEHQARRRAAIALASELIERYAPEAVVVAPVSGRA